MLILYSDHCDAVLSFGEKSRLGILGKFVFIDERRPKKSPVGGSTTGSIILLCQAQYLRTNVCLSRIC